MTIVLALANADYVIQLSDRRLSSGITVLSDQANKATVVSCVNGRFAVGFSGLASVGKFRTEEWFTGLLADHPDKDCSVLRVLEVFTERATRDFGEIPDVRRVSARDRRLSVMWSGHIFRDRSIIGNALVTNFQDAEAFTDSPEAWPAFRLYRWSDRGQENRTLVQRIGAWDAMSDDDVASLRAALERRLPPRDIISIGLKVIRSMAERPLARRSIGKSVSSVLLPADPTVRVRSEFHPHEGLDFVAGVNEVRIHPQGNIAIRDVRIEPVDKVVGAPHFIHKVRRNDPCPCRSGKKYKRCHGG